MWEQIPQILIFLMELQILKVPALNGFSSTQNQKSNVKR